jgi:hypothetical protein
VQCRVVWNLRLHNFLAQSRPLPTTGHTDPCLRFPVPDNLAEALKALEAEHQQLLAAFKEWK